MRKRIGMNAQNVIALLKIENRKYICANDTEKHSTCFYNNIHSVGSKSFFLFQRFSIFSRIPEKNVVATEL